MTAPAKQKAVSTDQAKRALYLSHFTPSMMLPETLEAMLVQREPLLTRVFGNVLESLRTGSRHHTLLVGPRGIGKTHLISLLHHRLSQTQDSKDKALIAWMREEEWGVTSFFELIMRILRTLDATYPQYDIVKRTNPLYELKVDDAAIQAETLLLDVLADKCLVVLMENLDDLFDQIGDQGQKAWRAFIQNHGNTVLVCTTPSLFAGVSIQKSPFYGLFDIEPLVELEFEDVVSLLRKIAIERGDADLAAFIDTAEGRARIRAVHHLAEGNPRIYIIFAQFLNHEALDELVHAFMHTLDELTPYYQSRMKELPAQQRKIIEYLVTYRGAASVKQIASASFITQQVCSSQLGQLKDKRYVRSNKEGRGSFYELNEPLMRLCMDVKQQRGAPISLIVGLLRIWYRLEELQIWQIDPKRSQSLESLYLDHAIDGLIKHGDPKIEAIFRDLRRAIQSKNNDRVLDLRGELRAIGVVEPDNWIYVAIALKRLDTSDHIFSSVEVHELAYELSKLIRNQDLFFDDPINEQIAYFGVSFATYRLSTKHGLAVISSLWEEIVLHPAESEFSMMLLIRRYGRDPAFPGWFKHLIENATILGKRLRVFKGLELVLAALQSGDPTKLWAIPSEQRKLFAKYFLPNFDRSI